MKLFGDTSTSESKMYPFLQAWLSTESPCCGSIVLVHKCKVGRDGTVSFLSASIGFTTRLLSEHFKNWIVFLSRPIIINALALERV